MSAKGAHFNVEYVKEFYKISNGEILAGQLKQCILQHAQSHNTSEWKDDLWAGKIASQLVCLLSHVRRLRRDPAKRRQCMQGATGEQRQAIQEFVALPAACKKATLPVQGSPASGDGQACKKAKKAKRSSSVSFSSEAQACKKAKSSSSASLPASQGAEACKKARVLKAKVSEVSLDSQGFPAMLASPKKMEKEKASKGDPKSISILEKQRASYRDQLEQAAKAAATDFVEKARPERRPSIAKKPASKQSQKAGSKKKTCS